MKAFTAVPFVVFLVCSSLCTALKERSLAQQLVAKLQPILDSKSKEWYNSGWVVGWRHGNETASLASGYNDMKNKVNATVNDKFLYGSTTKMVTATAVLQLVERGELTLDEMMAPYVNNLISRTVNKTNYTWSSLEDLFGPKINNVTVRQLLHMKSGISDYDDGDLRGYQDGHPLVDITPLDILNICPKNFTCDPGTCGAYSSTNFVILGLVLAEVSNASDWDQYNQRAVFKGNSVFNRTVFPLHGTCSAYAGIAHGYQEPPPGFADVYNVSCLGGWTCGNMAAPVEDVANFVYDLYGPPKAFLNSTTVQEMLAFEYLGTGAFPAWYGLGTMLLKSHYIPNKIFEYEFVGHGGATYGFYAMSGYNLLQNFSLVLATNMETPVFQENLEDVHAVVYNATVELMASYHRGGI